MSRTKNAVRNAAWGIVYRLVTLIGPFVVRTLIIHQLGLEYSGLNSLFTSILTVLNLANLGFSSSLVFTMYAAVEKKDYVALRAMLNFFRKVYRVVGVVILSIGLLILPFLPNLVSGSYPSSVNLYVIYLYYLIGTALDYFLFAYNNAIFSAYQRNDITLKVSTFRYLIQYVLQSIVLVIFKNYYLYLILLPIMVIPNNLALHFMAKKLYPEVYCEGELDAEVKKGIYNRVSTLFGHKLGSTVLVSIDSIIISAFLNLTVLSLYGNYYYIVTGVNGLVEVVTNGSLAGIGSKLITDSKEESYAFFQKMTYMWVTLIGSAATFMLCLFQPFIGGVWLGQKFLLSEPIMIFIVVYFYAWMFRIMQLTFRDAAGLWTKDWLKPYVGMLVNLIGSVVMVKHTNSVIGVLIPTIFVMFFIYTPWETWALFKFLFKQSAREYYMKLFYYTTVSFVGAGAIYLLCQTVIPENSFQSTVFRFFIVAICYPIIWLLFTYRSSEFKFWYEKISRRRKK
ncbi:TPA: polysaccharide biosynthesis protein [Streptococcus suis]|nr:polysaccharide biosynthesis protein [Streptococcus suis]